MLLTFQSSRNQHVWINAPGHTVTFHMLPPPFKTMYRWNPLYTADSTERRVTLIGSCCHAGISACWEQRRSWLCGAAHCNLSVNTVAFHGVVAYTVGLHLQHGEEAAHGSVCVSEKTKKLDTNPSIQSWAVRGWFLCVSSTVVLQILPTICVKTQAVTTYCPKSQVKNNNI